MSGLFASNLFRRVLTAVVVLPAVAAAIVLFPQRGPWVLAALLGILGIGEAHSLLGGADLRASHLSFLPGIALFFEIAGLPDAAQAFPISGLPVVAVVAAALAAVMRADRFGIPVLAAEAAGVLAGLLMGLGAGSFAALSSLRPMGDGVARIVLLLAVVIASDVFAYFVGHAIGRHKLAPVVSPGKSIEGAIGGLVGGGLAAALVGALLFKDQPLAVIVLVGLLVTTAGIAGDLLESLFKRYVGAKHSGTLFPGHGGVLDRIDSFILAAPLIYAFFKTVS